MKDAHAASYVRRCCCSIIVVVVIIIWWLCIRWRFKHVLRSLRRLGVDQKLINFIAANKASSALCIAHASRIDKRAVLGRSREMDRRKRPMTRVTVGSCESWTQLPDLRYDLGSRVGAATAAVRRAFGAVAGSVRSTGIRASCRLRGVDVLPTSVRAATSRRPSCSNRSASMIDARLRRPR
jgi:hypothetical protein